MGTKAHSTDLRSRVVAKVAAGSSRRQAAARFRVSVSSAIRWVTLWEERGGVDPRPRGGQSRSPLLAHTAWLLALIAAEPDLTLAASVAWQPRRLRSGGSTNAIVSALKKTLHAAEQDRADVAEARTAWKDSQGQLDPTKLVFLDG